MPTLKALHHAGFVGLSTHGAQSTAKCEDAKTLATGRTLLALASNGSAAVGTHLLLCSNYT